MNFYSVATWRKQTTAKPFRNPLTVSASSISMSLCLPERKDVWADPSALEASFLCALLFKNVLAFELSERLADPSAEA